MIINIYIYTLEKKYKACPWMFQLQQCNLRKMDQWRTSAVSPVACSIQNLFRSPSGIPTLGPLGYWGSGLLSTPTMLHNLGSNRNRMGMAMVMARGWWCLTVLIEIHGTQRGLSLLSCFFRVGGDLWSYHLHVVMVGCMISWYVCFWAHFQPQTWASNSRFSFLLLFPTDSSD